MNKTLKGLKKQLPLFLATALIAIVLSSCKAATTTSSATTTSPAATTAIKSPSVKISEPAGTVLPPGNIKISVVVDNFQVVSKLGQPNLTGEGHIHYFKDVDVPVTPGKPAVTAPGTYAATTDTSHTWSNVPPGQHSFSVELVNNDHTPLNPPVTATVSLLIAPESGSPSAVIVSPLAGASLAAGPLTVTVQAANFNVVAKLGQPNVQKEGHIHYFLDVDPPVTPGKPAVTAPGTYTASANTSYTWPNVGPGTHKLSIELVNNDHTPLDPPVVATVTAVIVTTSVTGQPPTAGY